MFSKTWCFRAEKDVIYSFLFRTHIVWEVKIFIRAKAVKVSYLWLIKWIFWWEWSKKIITFEKIYTKSHLSFVLLFLFSYLTLSRDPFILNVIREVFLNDAYLVTLAASLIIFLLSMCISINTFNYLFAETNYFNIYLDNFIFFVSLYYFKLKFQSSKFKIQTLGMWNHN